MNRLVRGKQGIEFDFKILSVTSFCCSIIIELLLLQFGASSNLVRIFPICATIFISLVSTDLDIIKFGIFLAISNGLLRRLLAGNEFHYIESDILIVLPLIPSCIYIFRRMNNLKEIPPLWIFFVGSLVAFSLPKIPTSGIAVVWGIFNTPILILSFLLGLHKFHIESFQFITKLANLNLAYLLIQAIHLPFYDYQWCLNRRAEFLQLMSCEFPDTRLWGTMESPAALGCLF